MGTLIDDLLSFSRTGRAELKKSTLKMNQVIEDALIQINPSLKDRKIDWKISTLPEVLVITICFVWFGLICLIMQLNIPRQRKAVISIGYKDEEEKQYSSLKIMV